MGLVAAPVAARFVIVGAVQIATAVPADPVAGQGTVIARDQNQRIAGLPGAIERIQHLPHHPVYYPNLIAARPGLALPARKLGVNAVGAGLVTRAGAEVKEKGRACLNLCQSTN